MNSEKYYIGLDMGTESVGWAVTDEKYNILRRHGKDLWGIREFDAANGAAERRINRISRRRRQREQVRIGMLKSYFHDAIMEKDELFFVRLDNSKYYEEDKAESLKSKFALFNDDGYTDVEYHKDYPTIFHLRKALLNLDDAEEIRKKNIQALQDARLVYLALLNMFKHRGHFLNDMNVNGENSRSVQEIYDELKVVFNDLAETDISDEEEQQSFKLADLSAEKINEMVDILHSNDTSPSQKHYNLLAVLEISRTKDKRDSEILKGLCGLKYDLKVIFPNAETEFKDMKLKNSDGNVDEKLLEYLPELNDEQQNAVKLLKEMFDSIALDKILEGSKFISEAMVKTYKKHEEDLAVLKSAIKTYCGKKEYNDMFRNDSNMSYSAYVKSYNSGEVHRRNFVTPKENVRDDLYKQIRKLLDDYKEYEDVKYILREIEMERFLPKQRTGANGTIPNSVHADEMKKILNNACKYLPFLNEIDESGLTVAERILQLFSFHLPFYVGPVTEKSAEHNGNGWVVRKEGGQVLPWNIQDKIDLNATNEEFVERMVRDCTYIEGAKVLPKASLLYENYCVLNEINNIKINNEKISVEQKQSLFNEKLCKGKRLTKKQIADFFGVEATGISGIDSPMTTCRSSYKRFFDIFGDEIKTDETKEMIEGIAKYATIYGDDKKMLSQKLEQAYPQLDSGIIKRICGMKFKDWGRMSKEMLLLKGCSKETGEIYTLLQAMWNSNLNLMELINSKDYTFGEELEKRMKKDFKLLAELTYDDLKGKYLSAPVKRMLWQTLLILKEIEGAMGYAPAKVFVEVTRSEEKKERKKSRKQQLIELYKSIGKEGAEWIKEIEGRTEDELRSKKLFLYYTQMGKDMYDTDKQIDLDDLMRGEKYDIDHIYPRHFVKDDSIHNNLVLVDKRINAKKQDEYPLKDNIVKKCKAHWKHLKEHGFISEEKYKRLTERTNIFDDDETRIGFINRQLVETSQANKAVADILQGAFSSDTKIVYSKAGHVSSFRNGENGSGHDVAGENGKMVKEGVIKFYKSRIVNDLHHAHDAYLNIVVGNVWYTKFEGDPRKFIINKYKKDTQKYNYNLNKMFCRDIEGAWKAGKNGTIATVQKTLAKPSPMLTRMTSEQKGEIAKVQPVGAKSAKNNVSYLPLKTTDSRLQNMEKYGGYQKVQNAYFFLVEHTKGKKRIRTIETLPIHVAQKAKNSPDFLHTYCVEKLELKDPDIRYAKIKPQSLIQFNGVRLNISGKSGTRFTVRNTDNLFLNNEWVGYIKELEKEKSAKITKELNNELYAALCEKHSKKCFRKRPNPMYEAIKKGSSVFEEKLDIAEQKKVLTEILKLTAIGLVNADLKLIGGSSQSGTMMISNNVSNATEFKLIHQSVTGLYEKVIDLKTI